MTDTYAKQRLENLRDLIHKSHLTSPTEIRHAMLIVEGKKLSSHELEKLWGRFTGCNFFSPPLKNGSGSFRRNPSWNDADDCLFGEASDLEVNRFKRVAEEVLPAALSFLEKLGFAYGGIPKGYKGLLFLAYCLAWDHPGHVSYSIKFHDFFEKFPVFAPGPFISRGAFEAWESGHLQLRRGHYFATLSMDVRFCIANAIDVILSLDRSAEAAICNKITISDNLNKSEILILDTLGDEVLTGKEVAMHLGAKDSSSHLREILSSLVKRNILVKTRQGYRKAR